MSNFKEIPGFTNYLIDADGNVYSKHVNRVIKSHVNSSGYYTIKLVENGVSRNLLLHRLLAFVFLDLPSLDSELEVDHKDTNKLNFHLDNLQVLTPDEHIVKTYKDNGYSIRPKCLCGKILNKGSKQCASCRDESQNTISIEEIEFWVTNFSWTRASKELGLSDNGLRKRYTKLTGLPAKTLTSARGTARCGHFALNEE